jgi:hypothetical protein
MNWELRCACGEVVTVTEAAAGATVHCRNGHALEVPSFSEWPATTAAPTNAPVHVPGSSTPAPSPSAGATAAPTNAPDGVAQGGAEVRTTDLAKHAENYAVRSWQWPLGVGFILIVLRATGIIDLKVSPNEESIRHNLKLLSYLGLIGLALAVIGMGSAFYALSLLRSHPETRSQHIRRNAVWGIVTNVVVIALVALLLVKLAQMASRL